MGSNKSRIIAIVGLPGSGKTLAADFFRNKNIPVLRFGEVTDEAIARQRLPFIQESEKKVREQLRRDFGMEAYAIKMEPKIHEAIKKQRFIVIDGLRSWEEYIYLKERFYHLSLLAIYAAPAIRYQRLSLRKERSLTIEEARARDIAELTALHMGPPIAIADYLVKNETSIDACYKDLEFASKKLGYEKY